MFYCPDCYNLYDIKQMNKKQSSKKESASSKDDAYFVCKNCGKYEKIKEGTLIASKYVNVSLHTDDILVDLNILNDPTLPITCNYICANKDCKTHKDPSLKQATFYRSSSNKIIYICRVCKTYWIP